VRRVASIALLVGACAGGRAGGGGAAASPPPAARAVDLAGSWRYLPYDGEGDMSQATIDDASWPSMDLPSNWFLLGQKTYPAKATAAPKSFGNNAPGELWPVDPDVGLDYAGTVWFRRTFEWDGDGARPAILDLDMVDYYAAVFVNGVPVGHHEGYFQKWSVDATRALHRGTNVVAVRVSAPALEFDMAQQYPVSWPKMQNQIKGIFGYHDTRPGATSWRGQERSTGGILRGVRLRESSGVDLSAVTVTPLDVSEASARLVVDATLVNWTASERRVSLDGVIRGATFDGDAPLAVHAELVAPPGTAHARTEVRLERPRLWWSWDYGRPNLYALDARISDGRAELDEARVRFGVRSISRDDGWVFRLNGQRIYPRGTNYIATQWLSQADREFYAKDLRLVMGANLNSIRVHAHIERQELYDLADELGIMVWQDFPLQWGYTDMPAFRDEALRQAGDMLQTLGDHPSIVVWCMHNESPHAMTWMKHRSPDQNLALDEALAARARELDPSRVVHRDSGTGDGHYYYGWYDGKLSDAASAEMVPFVTEYGAAALPAVETLRSMFDEATLWPDSPREWESWQYADFQPKNTFERAKVRRGRSIDEFVKSSQRYQAVAVRYTTELLRRRKWHGTTGIYQFMFVDDWPAITWAVVDYYRRPKAAYDALRTAMQRVLPSLEYAPDDPTKPIVLHVVNDLLMPLPGARVAWRIAEPGKSDVLGERTLDVPADDVIRVADLGVVNGSIDVTVTSAGGEVLGRAALGRDDYLENEP
jgi:beta-mannosidase